MRIAFLTPSIGEAFGQEQVVHESVRLLESVGHSCLVLSEKKLGIVPSYVNVRYCEGLSEVNTLSSKKFIRERHSQVLKHLSEFRCEIVHFVDLFDFRLLNEIADKYPSVMTSHSVTPTCPASHRLLKSDKACQSPSGWGCYLKDWNEGCLSHFKSPLHKLHAIQNFLLKKESANRRFKKFIAISHFMKEVLVKDGYDPDKIEVIYNPVRSQMPLTTGNKEKDNLIICAARLVPLKGVDHFIRALSRITRADFKALIFGEGPEKERLEAMVRNLSLQEKVLFKGKRPREELHAAMNNAKMLVQTNLGPEGFGLSAAESMLLGTPVVAYDIPALNELVLNNQTGFLCPLGEEKVLASHIEELLLNEELRKRFSKRGAIRAQELFSCQQFLEKTEKIYREALGLTISTESKILSRSFA